MDAKAPEVSRLIEADLTEGAELLALSELIDDLARRREAMRVGLYLHQAEATPPVERLDMKRDRGGGTAGITQEVGRAAA